MRNIALQFLDERTIEHIEQVNRAAQQQRPPAKTWPAKVWRTILENLDGDGPRSIANLERMMRPRP